MVTVRATLGMVKGLAMNHSEPTHRTIQTTWRTNVREIADALGIPLTPNHWVVLTDADGKIALDDRIDVICTETVRIDAGDSPGQKLAKLLQ